LSFITDSTVKLLPNQKLYFYGKTSSTLDFGILKAFSPSDASFALQLANVVPVGSQYKLVVVTDLLDRQGANLTDDICIGLLFFYFILFYLHLIHSFSFFGTNQKKNQYYYCIRIFVVVVANA